MPIYECIGSNSFDTDQISSAVDLLACRYEGTHLASSSHESQSGTMKSAPFFKMLKASIDGGIQSQTWIDAGCGAGIILLFLMVYNWVMKSSIKHFFGFDMVEEQITKSKTLLTIWNELTKDKSVTCSVICATFPQDYERIESKLKQFSGSRCFFVNNWSWNKELDENFKKDFLSSKLLDLEACSSSVHAFILKPDLLEPNTIHQVQLQMLCEFKDVASFNDRGSQKKIQSGDKIPQGASVYLFCNRTFEQRKFCDAIVTALQKHCWEVTANTFLAMLQSDVGYDSRPSRSLRGQSITLLHRSTPTSVIQITYTGILY